MAKKSIENGEDCDAIPESMRQYLAMQAAEQGKGFGALNGSFTGFGGFMAPDPSPSGKVLIHHLACRSLCVGTWRRVAQKNMDLIVFYSPQKACITYYINNDAAGYKIEYPFTSIKSIELETFDTPDSLNSGQKEGRLVVQLTQPPNFFMDSSNSGGFYQCGDFTENQQASQHMTHYLGGSAKQLATQLAKLTTLDVYVNRHLHLMQQQAMPQALNIYDHPSLSVSAPVSPHIIRPASSNDIVSQPTFRLQPPPENFQRHKRTRSRSVPVAIDFSQHPLPTFAFVNQPQTDHLYAPAPQYAIGPNLRIDTTAAGFFDIRNQPMSATTASPSDYASPPLLNASLQATDMAANGLDTPFTAPWVSPSIDPSSLGPCVSPLSMGHSDLDGSPQIRSSSADLYPMNDEGFSNSDLLAEMYSKQTLDLSGGPYDEAEDIDLQLMQFPMSQMSPEATVV